MQKLKVPLPVTALVTLNSTTSLGKTVPTLLNVLPVMSGALPAVKVASVQAIAFAEVELLLPELSDFTFARLR